jgi:hypothetical protein
VHGATLRLNLPGKLSARALVAGKELSAAQTPDGVELALPPVGAFEAIRISPM